MAECAVLSAIAAEVARCGLCRLTIGHIAALAGVLQGDGQDRDQAGPGARGPGLQRVAADGMALEWRTWLRMRDRKRAGGDHPRQAEVSFRVSDRLDTRRDDRRFGGGGPKSSEPLRNTSLFLKTKGKETPADRM